MNQFSMTGAPDRRLPVPDASDTSPFITVLRRELARQGLPLSSLSFDAMWCFVHPPQAVHPEQGWKLHVSAVADAAPGTLERVARILLARRCAFKCAGTPERLELLNSARYPRPGAGKFITVYPEDDHAAVELAEDLHRATRGRPGPAVLSDRPFRDGSVVHYRYGAFSARRVLTNDGEYVGALAVPGTGPPARVVVDARHAWFAPPEWADCPFEPPEGSADARHDTAAAPRPAQVLLGGRFVAQEAIRQSNRGGVYRAKDQETGATVVVKQARRHVSGNAGTPARTALRHEARVLSELEPLGRTPAVLASFTQNGDAFLAQHHVDGTVLGRWVRERAGAVGASTRSEPGVPLPDACRLLTRLVATLRDLHGAGWVLRDLSPNNVMVAEDGTLTVIDLEFATRVGAEAAPGGTPGYAAPEQLSGGAAQCTADLFSLGGIAFLLATSVEPAFPDDAPDGRAPGEKRAEWLAAAARSGATAAALAPLVEGLTADHPEQRWPLEKVADWLAARSRPGHPPAESGPPSGGHRPGGHRPGALPRRVLADGLEHLCATFDPDAALGDGPWPRACTSGSVDRTSVQHGSAGVIGVLSRALDAGHGGADLPDVLTRACDWTLQQLRGRTRVLPGLYFGSSGTAWALLDAAGALKDDRFADAAAELALSVPTEWENPDVAHGLAGAGLAQLHFWRRTADPRFRIRYRACARRLAARAEHDGGDVRWPIPRTFDSRLAGLTHLGHAHGCAGIAGFLLEAGLEEDREDWQRLAARTARYLVRADASADEDTALWPSSADDASDPTEHGCSGASGVGRFLLRCWEVTRAPGLLDASDRAARSVHRRRWHGSPVQCHGLAGNGEFLLDLAAATGEERYRRWAQDLVDTTLLRRTVRDGRLLVPDETTTGFGAEYGVGMTGFLGFLLRLHTGRDRQWTVRASAP